ncbi:MAG: sodium:calcium antiporter, partial [Ruminiclostridium sp.]|nr:sodium:calcium antiporter [Ruminiclostridium sp.]
IIAILFTAGSGNNVDIGIGAIIGAPFMLSTLAFFLTGMSVLVFWKKRKSGLAMHVNEKILSRDIGFFIIIYSIGVTASFFDIQILKYLIAAFLIGYYVYYIILTVKNDVCNHCELENLYLARLFKFKPELASIVIQIAIALAGIVFGAEIFVGSIGRTSEIFGISALALSLIITPVATELPEKFNSIIWISKRKDTLAMGNITGAMVFQSCIPVSIGILATHWQLDTKALVSALMALLSSLVVFLWLKLKGSLNPVPLIIGGIFYAAFIGYLVSTGFR